MTQINSASLDALMKRIYLSYIDIKSGDIHEINRDILLENVRQLYTELKTLFPNYDEKYSAWEKELIQERNLHTQTHSLPTDEVHTSVKEDIEVSTSNTIEDLPKTEVKIDLSIFQDDEELGETRSEEKSTIQISTKSVESIFSANNPIVQNIITNDLASQLSDTPKNIQEKPQTIEQSNEAEFLETTDLQSTPILISESDKKSTNKIMDFLHAEEHPKRDIYQLLDINTRIGLVELFFKGNSLELTECLVKVNRTASKGEAIEVMNKYAQQFQVKDSEDIYQSFYQLIERKFQ